MTKVKLVHLDGSRSEALVLVPEAHVPKLLRRGDKMFVLCAPQGDRLTFEETELLDIFTEEEIKHAKKSGHLT